MTNNAKMSGKGSESVTVFDQETLGDLVRARRKELSLTLEEAAERLGVSKRLLLDMEKGRRGVRIDTVIRILNLLGLDLMVRGRANRLQ